MIKVSRFFGNPIAIFIASSSLMAQSWLSRPLYAQPTAYCQFPEDAIAQKDALLKSSLKGNPNAQKEYQSLIQNTPNGCSSVALGLGRNNRRFGCAFIHVTFVWERSMLP